MEAKIEVYFQFIQTKKTTTMKHILVPTDFSDNAFSALTYATHLFEDEACTFFILNSFESQVSQLTSRVDIARTKGIVEELYNETDVKCEEVISKIKALHDNPKHTYRVISTSLSLFRAVNTLIEKEGVEFAVIGSKGKTAAEDILMGSNALKMIEKIKGAALLVIPENIEFTPINHIAFATGFKRNLHKNELDPLLSLAHTFNSSVSIVHMQQQDALDATQQLHQKNIIKLLKELNPQSNWLETKDGIDIAIANHIQRGSIDMLAMIFYKHNVFVKLFREATVKNLAKKSTIPFLILPTSE